MNIPLRVKNLITRYDTSAPYRIAKELNCIVLFAKLPPNVNGFWKRILRRRAIIINENLSEWQQTASFVTNSRTSCAIRDMQLSPCATRHTQAPASRTRRTHSPSVLCPIVTISTSATCAASSRRDGGHKKTAPRVVGRNLYGHIRL